MIKEMAHGLGNRHHFIEEAKISDWYGTPSDTFCSLYDYDDDVKEYVKQKGKLSGFDSKIYMPSEFLLDIDGATVDEARQKVIGLTILLNDLNIPYNAYFSGTGFHLGIPATCFRWEGARDLHLKVKDELTAKGIFEFADVSVTDKTRIIRLLNTKNSKSGLFKVYLKPAELHLHPDEIIALAKFPRKEMPRELECDAVFDVTTRKKSSLKISVKPEQIGRRPDPVEFPCIQTMLDGVGFGSRHQIALVLSSHFRWRYPEEVVNTIMEQWRQKVTTEEKPFTANEMKRLINDTYEGHGGAGYKYGCSNVHMDKHCQATCKLYKSKKSQNALSAEAMEDMLINFIKSNVKPIDIGSLYGKKFPIYPGEVVVLQGPPKSMKTMLLQNWLNALKRPTYFLELEMSARQMMSRFAMMETGMEEDELNRYLLGGGRVSDKFKWLTIDYSPCKAYEIQKRIQMQPIKPEIVVVDHMGLFHSNHKDNNMKVEEASQALMELATQNNIVVFTVSEIGKESFKEGMNIASARGSFRVAYNANKILGVTPKKDNDGLVKSLTVTTIANRERESLNIKLDVNNVILTAAQDKPSQPVTLTTAKEYR
jgi:hypothetical protein